MTHRYEVGMTLRGKYFSKDISILDIFLKSYTNTCNSMNNVHGLVEKNDVCKLWMYQFVCWYLRLSCVDIVLCSCGHIWFKQIYHSSLSRNECYLISRLKERKWKNDMFLQSLGLWSIITVATLVQIGLWGKFIATVSIQSRVD